MQTENLNRQIYFDPGRNVPEYELEDITEDETYMMLLYRLLTPEQQAQIMETLKKETATAEN